VYSIDSMALCTAIGNSDQGGKQATQQQAIQFNSFRHVYIPLSCPSTVMDSTSLSAHLYPRQYYSSYSSEASVISFPWFILY
jgi:hypothetical protein